MKNIVLLLCGVFCFVAFADNSLVGTSATYAFKAASLKGKTKVEITSFDADKETYTQVTTTITSDGENLDREVIPVSDISTSEQSLEILSICEEELGGTLEILSVKAGKFKTCVITESENKESETKTYLANVPFGMIKLIADNQTVELIRFKSAE